MPLVPANGVLHGDKGYDSDRIRRTVEARGSLPNIPPRKTRKWKNCFSPYLYKGRNVIERMFGRLKGNHPILVGYKTGLQAAVLSFIAGVYIHVSITLKCAASHGLEFRWPIRSGDICFVLCTSLVVGTS